MNNYRILVVDDEEDICNILQYNLEKEGYFVDVAYSAEEALKKDLSVYCLLLLDVMMGKISGFDMANILKNNKKQSNIPFIFITAKTDEYCRLEGLSIGANDYIYKPFCINEVNKRIKSVLIQTELKKHFEYQFLYYENIEINLVNKKILIDKIDISCTNEEFNILKIFLENKNRVFTYEELQLRIWMGKNQEHKSRIDKDINQLRKKIGQYERNIVNHNGLGFCFQELKD